MIHCNMIILASSFCAYTLKLRRGEYPVQIALLSPQSLFHDVEDYWSAAEGIWVRPLLQFRHGESIFGVLLYMHWVPERCQTLERGLRSRIHPPSLRGWRECAELPITRNVVPSVLITLLPLTTWYTLFYNPPAYLGVGLSQCTCTVVATTPTHWRPYRS